ncbi:DEAD/DEAH box helicase family protein [Arthrobacter sp. OVS8]|nr:DEAD/DEAH box helicase family protein [Arthrobacter sp. OVS8]
MKGDFEPATAASVPTSYDYAFLYSWQQEALKAWHSNARRGVVEAVTGSGKTRVGIAAAFEAVRQGIKVLILVPTAELQRQWLSSIQRDLPGSAGADWAMAAQIHWATWTSWWRLSTRRPTGRRCEATRPG